MELWRAVDVHNGGEETQNRGLEAQNGAVEDLQIGGPRFPFVKDQDPGPDLELNQNE